MQELSTDVIDSSADEKIVTSTVEHPKTGEEYQIRVEQASVGDIAKIESGNGLEGTDEVFDLFWDYLETDIKHWSKFQGEAELVWLDEIIRGILRAWGVEDEQIDQAAEELEIAGNVT